MGSPYLTAFANLVEACGEEHWRTYLGWSEDGWFLEVWDGEELLTQVVSRAGTPQAFYELACQAAADLGSLL